MTTAGFLTSWSGNKALYFTLNDTAYNRIYGRLIPREGTTSTDTTAPFAKLGTAANYAGYIQPHQLKLYMASNDAPTSQQKLNWLKQGNVTPELLLGGASGVNTADGQIDETPFGVLVKFAGSNLYLIDESGVLAQTITPQDLGGAGATAGSTNDYSRYPSTIGTHSTDFAFISVGGQVCIYRPTTSPGAQPERLSLVGASPNSSSYNANCLVYSHKWNRLFWTADKPAGPRMAYATPGSGASFASTDIAVVNYALSVQIFNGDPIVLGQDDKLYRSTDGGVTYSLFLNIDTLCNAMAFRYLATDHRSIFVNGISNTSGNSILYQIDTNLAVREWQTFSGQADYDPNTLATGHII